MMKLLPLLLLTFALSLGVACSSEPAVPTTKQTATPTRMLAPKVVATSKPIPIPTPPLSFDDAVATRVVEKAIEEAADAILEATATAIAIPTATVKPSPTAVQEIKEVVAQPSNADSPKESSKPTIYTIPTFEILNEHPEMSCMNTVMDIFIEVFGMYVMSTTSAPPEFVLHTANILAEFIDNDLDGVPDEPAVQDYLAKNNYVVAVWTTDLRDAFWENARGTFCEDNVGMGASMYYDGDAWAIGGIKQTGTWDTNLEEVWHVISRGWYATYPEAFGNAEDINESSLLRQAMDAARGGQFDRVPTEYPKTAWYTYDDTSCWYHCQVTEYFYWTLMTNIGALDPGVTDKCRHSQSEWHICTKADLETQDKLIYGLLNDPTFNLPKRIPLGSYSPDK